MAKIPETTEVNIATIEYGADIECIIRAVNRKHVVWVEKMVAEEMISKGLDMRVATDEEMKNYTSNYIVAHSTKVDYSKQTLYIVQRLSFIDERIKKVIKVTLYPDDACLKHFLMRHGRDDLIRCSITHKVIVEQEERGISLGEMIKTIRQINLRIVQHLTLIGEKEEAIEPCDVKIDQDEQYNKPASMATQYAVDRAEIKVDERLCRIYGKNWRELRIANIPKGTVFNFNGVIINLIVAIITLIGVSAILMWAVVRKTKPSTLQWITSYIWQYVMPRTSTNW